MDIHLLDTCDANGPILRTKYRLVRTSDMDEVKLGAKPETGASF
jgi:hypothetical protein